MSRTAPAPTGFTLRVPDSWWEFDVWRASRTGDLARLLDRQARRSPQLAPHRGALLKVLRRTAEHAERNGARFCAVSIDDVDGAGSAGATYGAGLLLATAMVFQTDGAPDATANTPEAIAGRVTATAPVEGSTTWRRVELVEVPAGRAARVYGVELTDLGAGEPVETVVMQTLLPVPDDRGVLDLVLTSPQVNLAEPMLDLFDAISGTLDWSGQR